MVDIDLRSFEAFESELSEGGARTTAEELEQRGGQALEFERDLTDPSAMPEVVSEVVRAWSRMDIAAFIAGGGSGTYDETRASVVEDNVLDLVIARNLNSTIYSCKAVSPVMLIVPHRVV